ncbi:MAG TPA: tRNA (guanosine(37)-N1)-methyltransferase TrmD [Candidatus Saccharimonadales bacterium]|nr:tRNA (guanosine(37)-N1)-methyltransferase TrmD [Candidatus Saccharimonadales bacterium]
MKVCYISLFPEVIKAYNNVGMMRKAQEIGAVEFIYLNLRDFGLGPRKQVDDNPYGGGDGMVLKPEPIAAAISKAKEIVGDDSLVILPTPRGEEFTQKESNDLAKLNKNLIIFCPRYEGYDERITKLVDKQFFIGRYVLTGGEIPAMVISDSVIRLLDGVLGGADSTEKESFQMDLSLIEHPQYTRPEIFEGESIPEVLKGGNHAEIEKWRQENYIT